jgi:hypothetical protein
MIIVSDSHSHGDGRWNILTYNASSSTDLERLFICSVVVTEGGMKRRLEE